MTRPFEKTLEGFGETVRQLALGEIAQGASIANVVKILAGLTGAVAAADIKLRPDSQERVHAEINEYVAKGLTAHRRAEGCKS